MPNDTYSSKRTSTEHAIAPASRKDGCKLEGGSDERTVQKGFSAVLEKGANGSAAPQQRTSRSRFEPPTTSRPQSAKRSGRRSPSLAVRGPATQVKASRKGRFPYIVVRLMGGVYQREEIAVHVGAPRMHVGPRSSYVFHPEPFTEAGEISCGCRELLVKGVLSAVHQYRFRMCLVWSLDACTYCRDDGTWLDSYSPPSGGIGSGGIDGMPLPFGVAFDQREVSPPNGKEQGDAE